MATTPDSISGVEFDLSSTGSDCRTPKTRAFSASGVAVPNGSTQGTTGPKQTDTLPRMLRVWKGMCDLECVNRKCWIFTTI